MLAVREMSSAPDALIRAQLVESRVDIADEWYDVQSSEHVAKHIIKADDVFGYAGPEEGNRNGKDPAILTYREGDGYAGPEEGNRNLTKYQCRVRISTTFRCGNAGPTEGIRNSIEREAAAQRHRPNR